MDMNHLIGQIFNLISKSDIRYVGTLHEINPEASTIALENVISYGTEGRRGNPTEEIAPSDSVYEYIVFRGSDVKDISVAEGNKENAQPEPPQVPNDPAILGSMSRPGPPQSRKPSQAPQQSQAPRPGPANYPQQPQFQGFYPSYGQRFDPPGYPTGPGFTTYGAPPGWYPSPGHNFPQAPIQFPPPQVPIGPPNNRQRPAAPTTPGAPSNIPHPTSELPVGDKASGKPASKSATPVLAVSQSTAPPAAESKSSAMEASQPVATAPTQPATVVKSISVPVAASSPAAISTTTPSKVPPSGPKNDRFVPAIPLSNPPLKPAVPISASHPLNSTPGNAASQSTAQAAINEAARAATAAVAAAMAKLPQPNSQKKPQPADLSVEGVTKKLNEIKPFDGNRNHRGAHQGNRGGRGGHRGQHQHHHKKIEVPDTDFDFESANAKFNKHDLVKEAIASGSPVGEPEEKDVNGTSVEGPNGAILSVTAPTVTMAAYNKASSFFDNISSEIRDREEGTVSRGRERRGEEEKKNIETFGQGSVDGFRGGYRSRGRGRYYGGPRARVGYNRGYGNNRGRGSVRGGRDASRVPGVSAQT